MKNCLYIFLFFTLSLYSQSVPKQIDSLMQVAQKANDSTRLRIYNKVSFYYIFNDPPKAKKLLRESILDAKNKNIPFSEAELVNTYGIYYDVSGKADSAKYYFEKALELSQKKDYKNITVMIINNLGMFHWNKGNYQQALDYFFQALEMNNSIVTTNGNASYYNNIGLIYQEMGQYDRALEYHKKALQDRRKYNDLKEIPTSLANIGVVLGAKGQYEGAEKSFNEAIEAAKDANELGKYYDALSGLSDIYIIQKKPEKAIPLLQELLEGRNKYNIDRRSNLEAIAHVIEAYNDFGNLPEALKYVNMGNLFLEEFPDIRNAAVDFYQNASETYFRANNPQKGGEYLQKAIAAKEQIFSTENAESIANLETKFKVAEQEKALAETRANLAETQLEVEQKNTLLYGSLILALVLGLLGYLFYNQQKLKNRQLQKESELKTALAKIETQNELQEQRLRISRDLHDNIGSQLTFIISSIDNLKYGFSEISDKLGNKLSGISNFTTQTIYELRDTIWAMNKESITFEDLQARISNFIEHAKNASESTEFSFQINKDVDETHVFTSVEGMNIYRIIQEAVNNALKYAHADEIDVNISKKENHYQIEIIDNGKGFDTETVELGNGLSNMKKRAREIGGMLQIKSSQKGTGILLVTD